MKEEVAAAWLAAAEVSESAPKVEICAALVVV